jgi:hypothetical protein
MATEADRLDGCNWTGQQRKTNLTHTGLLMEGLGCVRGDGFHSSAILWYEALIGNVAPTGIYVSFEAKPQKSPSWDFRAKMGMRCDG